ncbi:nucleotidyltransferase family protein [Methylobacillus flagellatus]|uniref:nucleotidyltransferase family protein n=1 Tax=Methylobacillus flagellatus TaxID=405 RepID=UPI002853DF99|nr:nucleotidyltransferase family protein [Methylobacillus flagellatus]MDR5171995.1 nucleotidyltransferase family protein [Methylobacillus flagellatus]
MNVTGILLAAGHSRRFTHGNKLLYPLQPGQPTAIVSAQHLLAALPHSLAVVRPETPDLATLLSGIGMEVLLCQPEQQEMADSLAAAVRHVLLRPAPPDAVVVALADMPFIRPETIAAVAGQLAAGAHIAAPAYQGVRGHPVGFGRHFFTELASLTGDEGARSVLRRHAKEIRLLECDDPGILKDFDTWEELQRLLPQP